MNKKELIEIFGREDLMIQHQKWNSDAGKYEWGEIVEMDSELSELIQEELGFKVDGIEFKSVTNYRTEGDGDYNGYEWVCQFGDAFFCWYGTYCSWNGTSLSESEFIEVVEKTKTITSWEPKEGEEDE